MPSKNSLEEVDLMKLAALTTSKPAEEPEKPKSSSEGIKALKLLITGPPDAGKTQFIQAVSEIDVVSTDKKLTEDEIVVNIDFGRFTVDENLIFYLFGVPGQRRFDFAWEIPGEGMLGYIVVVDSSKPETFGDAKNILDVFRTYAPLPYVVAANKQDHPDAWELERLRTALCLDENVKLLPCVARDKYSVRSVILELIYSIIEEQGKRT